MIARRHVPPGPPVSIPLLSIGREAQERNIAGWPITTSPFSSPGPASSTARRRSSQEVLCPSWQQSWITGCRDGGTVRYGQRSRSRLDTRHPPPRHSTGHALTAPRPSPMHLVAQPGTGWCCPHLCVRSGGSTASGERRQVRSRVPGALLVGAPPRLAGMLLPLRSMHRPPLQRLTGCSGHLRPPLAAR